MAYGLQSKLAFWDSKTQIMDLLVDGDTTQAQMLTDEVTL